MPGDFVKDLVQHKQWVAENMQLAANDLFRRAALHDNSKFSPEEFDAYEEAFPDLQKYAYGTEEYRTALFMIKPAIRHHYAVNDHHPEFFAGGIGQMNLVQLLEMVCDWMAASKRSQTGIAKGPEINKERYGIDDQLFGIIKQTVDALLNGGNDE